jgi:hypothetical protein
VGAREPPTFPPVRLARPSLWSANSGISGLDWWLYGASLCSPFSNFRFSIETVPVFGATDKPGPYVVLIKWYPGYMSAPHTYVTDRLCFVISGTWWVNSGENFEPDATVPVPAGGFVRRVARTPHYDGVKKVGKEPAVIGIFGQAPIEFKLTDPTMPPVREV